MHSQNLSQACLRESIAGEEDPGASLDIVRGMFLAGQKAAATQPRQQIHMDCTEGADVIAVDVAWSHRDARSAADLLGVVVAYHGQIASAAWSLFNRTGQRSFELEVDESQDGVFYVSRKDS